MDDFIVTVNDLREANFCAKGARAFAASHGIDWTQFVLKGVKASILLACNDAMATKLVTAAKKRLGIEEESEVVNG